jgi:hypothetical protein
MSMKGDLPGASNRCAGTIGSCQYRMRRPVLGSMSPGRSVAPLEVDPPER